MREAPTHVVTTIQSSDASDAASILRHLVLARPWAPPRLTVVTAGLDPRDVDMIVRILPETSFVRAPALQGRHDARRFALQLASDRAAVYLGPRELSVWNIDGAAASAGKRRGAVRRAPRAVMPHPVFLDTVATLATLPAELAAYYAAQRDTATESVEPEFSPVDAREVIARAAAERAASRYPAAQILLRLARQPKTVATALSEEADVAWVVHDYPRATELALEALRHDYTARKAQVVRDRAAAPLTDAAVLERPGPHLAHAAFYVSRGGNFGDVALPDALRAAVDEGTARSTEWLPIHAHQVFDDERVELVNRTEGIVVGGGGLFLPDTAPNRNSGWQWNIPRASLDRISVPIGVMTVGYNLFPGQSFEGNLFRDSLVRLVERSAVIGLRNHGSVQRVRDLIPSSLRDKVTFMPCATTVLERLQSFDAPVVGSGLVLVNAAYDRSERRFGSTYRVVLRQLARYVSSLQSMGVDVRLAAHLPADEKLSEHLADAHGILLPVDALYDGTREEGYRRYRSASVVVGMRGHASMIPFGLGTPILSLISHPKMRFFLDDIGRPEWGFEIDDRHLGDALTERTRDILSNESAVRADIAELQLGLLGPIRDGVATFRRMIESA